jgi:lipopolysaccharide transport system ATP-binding protein
VSADVLIELDGVAKHFPRVSRPRDRMRALWRLLTGRMPNEPARILQNIDLRVRRGESLGIIGENGAGKSTLLKVITGVLAPSAGRVRVNGSMAALLELGAGFHPEFTGRENIQMAGTLMGFSAAELRARQREIEAFADIGDYLDEPVKHYSSGMVVRLGFALVAARRPDLLITDEVLAVGDEAFQRKCVRWIEDYLAGQGTLLLVSHSTYHIQKLCRHACWIDRGVVRAYGDVYEVTQQYLAFQESKIAAQAGESQAAAAHGEFSVSAVHLIGGDGAEIHAIEIGDALTARVELLSRSEREPVVVIGIVRADGTPVYGLTSEMEGAKPRVLGARRYAFELRYPALNLLPGAYRLRAHAMDPEGLRLFDTVERDFTVRGQSREMGLVRLAHHWVDDVH